MNTQFEKLDLELLKRKPSDDESNHTHLVNYTPDLIETIIRFKSQFEPEDAIIVPCGTESLFYETTGHSFPLVGYNKVKYSDNQEMPVTQEIYSMPELRILYIHQVVPPDDLSFLLVTGFPSEVDELLKSIDFWKKLILPIGPVKTEDQYRLICEMGIHFAYYFEIRLKLK